MQLDKTYIAIRERDFMEIMDLSLHVVKRFAAPLSVALLAGIVPLALASHFYAFGMAPMEEDLTWGWYYTLWILFLASLGAPLAGAPATLLLGQALFMEQPSARRIAQDFMSALPQLLLFQIVVRGLLIVLFFTAFIPFVLRPYLGEIILLERNPLLKGKENRITTMKRSNALHGGSGGELFGRWLSSMLVGGLLILIIMLALWGCTQWVTGMADLDRVTYACYLQIAVWTVVGYFTVVRFLSYLDLRIRREGWEVELKMRAEATRLQGELV
jgi:hypothetical protein